MNREEITFLRIFDSCSFPDQLLLLPLPLVPQPPAQHCQLTGVGENKEKENNEKDLGNFFSSLWELVLSFSFEKNQRVLRISLCVYHSARSEGSYCFEYKPGDTRGEKLVNSPPVQWYSEFFILSNPSADIYFSQTSNNSSIHSRQV